MSDGLWDSELSFNPNPETLLALTETSKDSGSASVIVRAASLRHPYDNAALKCNTRRKTSELSRHRSECVGVRSRPGSSNKDTISEREGNGTLQKSTSKFSSLKNQYMPKQHTTQSAIPNLLTGTNASSEDLEDQWNNGQAPNGTHKPRSRAGSLATLALKSWVLPSQPDLSFPKKGRSGKELGVAIDKVSGPTPVTDAIHNVWDLREATKSDGDSEVVLASNGLTRRTERSPIPDSNELPSPFTPSIAPIPASIPAERLTAFADIAPIYDAKTRLRASESHDGLEDLAGERPRRKDPLWSNFKDLDGQYQKFQSRPSTLKTAIVRSALLPFLRTYAEHRSTLSLRPEDLDRRIVVLNKWWTGLLSMLNGRHGETVTGNDRTAVLEALTALMARSEWTQPIHASTFGSGKTARSSLKSKSTTSLRSTMTMSSDFLIESISHNIRNLFSQNLLAQMEYVVNKMSTRNTAASVVTFCGKAAAFAFFYCEGVAEILVRLWAIKQDVLRRIFAEYGLPKEGHLDPNIPDNIRTAFPPCLNSLRPKSLWATMRYLRSKPPISLATTYISWHSPWVERWSGKDSDLLFAFTKVYTDLTCRYLPAEPSAEELMAAPGWPLVQAQLLTHLDSTIQRTSSMTNAIHIKESSPSTFDEILGDAEAIATPIPIPASEAARSMAETRVIVLLRECLSSTTLLTSKAKSICAQSFACLLKATARRTSLFNHSACFALLDLLEEAFAILIRYSEGSGSKIAVIDWSFWLDSCKGMLQSQNIMTDVRLYAFLYAMWPHIMKDGARKRKVCLDWLLTDVTFQAQFSHWCPMVRAYFMRLLVWRVARLNGSIHDTLVDEGHSQPYALDLAILQRLSERIQESWGHYLNLQRYSENNGIPPPSTVACSPAPGRCLLIARNESQQSLDRILLSFDDVLSPSTTTVANLYEGHGSSPKSMKPSGNVKANAVSDGNRKRWNLFKSFMPTSASRARSSPLGSHIGTGINNTPRLNRIGNSTYHNCSTAPPPHNLSFRFCLEWVDQSQVGTRKGEAKVLQPPKLPFPARMALQSGHATTHSDIAIRPKSGHSKYTGSALAEWALLVTECQNFFEKRKAEGIATYQMVETPILSVDSFRKP